MTMNNRPIGVCLRCRQPLTEADHLHDEIRVLCRACRRAAPTVEPSPKRTVTDREQEKRDMRRRLALIRAERSAKQRRAMGLPG